jgi:NAD+ kinase
MKTIGIVYHPNREDSSRLAEQLRGLLQQHKVPMWQGSADELARSGVASELEMVFTLGGDGTIVRTARAMSGCSVPVLGVNLGRLGFLAEVEPDDLERAFWAVVEHRYDVEQRMMLHAEVWRGERLLAQSEAINDIVLARGGTLSTVQVSIAVDGHYLMTQVADGIIISTPTGTTAYCLAAGGPIVAPDLHCITLTPVAAHLSMAHAVVVPPQREVCLSLVAGSDAVVSVDGQIDLALEPGDRVIGSISERKACFVRFGGDGHFYETVLRRLRWPDRVRTT